MRRIIAALALTATLGLATVAAIALADRHPIGETTSTQVAEPAEPTVPTATTKATGADHAGVRRPERPRHHARDDEGGRGSDD